MNIFMLILFLVCFIGIVTCLWAMKRTNKVYEFRLSISDLCFKYCNKHIRELDYVSAYDWFWCKETASYNDMLWSTKKLELSSWFDKDSINKLLT